MSSYEIANVVDSSDEEKSADVETLVLNQKAFHVAESYVLALFHLYPNVYFHKATRGAEVVFKDFILRLFDLIQKGNLSRTHLSSNHPLVRFIEAPDDLQRALALDDTVLWGSLSILVCCEDEILARRARQLLGRHLLECIDIWAYSADILKAPRSETMEERAKRIAQINLCCDRSIDKSAAMPTVLIDDYTRDPYKRFQDQASGTPLNQIHILQGGQPRDMAELSAVVRSAERFRICRAYFTRGDTTTRDMLQNIIRTSIDGASDAKS